MENKEKKKKIKTKEKRRDQRPWWVRTKKEKKGEKNRGRKRMIDFSFL